MKTRIRAMMFAAALVGLPGLFAQGNQAPANRPPSVQNTEARIEKDVRHKLVTLPFYGVFDNFAYRVDGGTVTLSGQVTQPVTKSDAEFAVKRVEGVDQVVNDIEVLPLSPNDDRIRRAVFRAVYSSPGLNRYALQAVPSVHIVVKNGHVTLEGAVANGMDKQIAGMRANSVPGVFSVENHLQVDRS